jgi:7-cyano-7-deazaguanine synthase
MNKKAVILLSGGLDSATALAVAHRDGYETYAISFNYKQRHIVELDFARKTGAAQGVKDHVIVDFDLRQFGGSALTSNIQVPKGRDLDQMTESIPVTYVPGRNTIFLGHALSYAEIIGASAIFTGVNALDYSGYPDCRPEYIEAYQSVVNLATKRTTEDQEMITVEAPLIQLTKVEIIQLGTELDVDYSLTSSCYDPTEDGHACGECDSCILRKQGFVDAGLSDPTRYVS